MCCRQFRTGCWTFPLISTILRPCEEDQAARLAIGLAQEGARCAEVTQKKVARKPKDHTISLQRYWRSFGPGGRACVVLGIVTILILLLCIFAMSVSRIDRAMAQELELEQQKAAAKQDKRR